MKKKQREQYFHGHSKNNSLYVGKYQSLNRLFLKCKINYFIQIY